MWSWALMLVITQYHLDQCQLPLHPKNVGLGWSQGSLQASKVIPKQTQGERKKIIVDRILLNAQGYCHVETRKGLPQTVVTTLKAHRCLKYHYGVTAVFLLIGIKQHRDRVLHILAIKCTQFNILSPRICKRVKPNNRLHFSRNSTAVLHVLNKFQPLTKPAQLKSY